MAGYSSFVSHRYVHAVAAASAEDAIGYVEAVRGAFKDRRPATYQEFLRVMDDFRNHRIGIAEVASRVKALFRDSPGLTVGFNAFLPKGYKIQVVAVDELAACFIRDMSLDDDDDVDHSCLMDPSQYYSSS